MARRLDDVRLAVMMLDGLQIAPEITTDAKVKFEQQGEGWGDYYAMVGLIGQARRLELRQPEVLGQAIVQFAGQPLALPLAEAPEVALDLPRVDLAAGQVHVGLVDEPALVALQRHPLGQHVV